MTLHFRQGKLEAHERQAIFALLCAGAVSQHLFVAFQIHCQGSQNDGGIVLVSMTNAEVDPSRYRKCRCGCSGRCRQTSNCWVRLWLRQLIMLALGATPSRVEPLLRLCACSFLRQTLRSCYVCSSLQETTHALHSMCIGSATPTTTGRGSSFTWRRNTSDRA